MRATVEYDGANYAGFQWQPALPNVQGTLERAVEGATGCRTRVVGAGRTDRGAHAVGQVIAFDVDTRLDNSVLVRALNAHLPADIALTSLNTVAEDFHPRFDAAEREYHYLVLNRPARSPHWRGRAHHVPQALNLEAMRQAAASLVGRHDFSSFTSASADEAEGRNRSRTLRDIDIKQEGEIVRFRFIGDAFMRHMVRTIVGVLLQVGMGMMPVEQVRGILEQRDRRLAGEGVPAWGLYLMRVSYPDEHEGIPGANPGFENTTP
ncbi:MAG TPA: tRNA pseudouridine(38-40) synthase TruA [Chloroflexota bacterium]|nr:tRNA pseudouridine(38-40) synthase TruA [Chloroflexota bacterium]